jgi:putative transposase
MADNTMPGLPAVRNLVAGDPDLLRGLVEQTVNALLSADADAVCGADWGERSAERSNRRNGYRERRWDTRAGTIDLRIPKLREGSYFPDWLLERRRRPEKALISVVADLYLAGVSTRRVEKAVAQLGVESISKSQVSRLAGELDELVEAFRTREGNGHGNTLARTAAPRRPATPQLARPSSQTTAPSATERSGQAAMAAPI